MLLPHIVNAIGLFFFLGVMLLFFSAGPPWGSLDRVEPWSWVAVVRVVLGFVIQSVSNHL